MFKQMPPFCRPLMGLAAALLLAGCTLVGTTEDADSAAEDIAQRLALLEQKAADCKAQSTDEIREELLDQRSVWELGERAGFYPARQKLTQGVLEVAFEERIIQQEKRFDRYQRLRHNFTARFLDDHDDSTKAPAMECVEGWEPFEIVRRNERYTERSREQWRPLSAETLILEVRGLDYQQQEYARHTQNVTLTDAGNNGFQLALSLTELASKLPARPTEMQLIFHQERSQHTATINLSRGIVNSLGFETGLWPQPATPREARRTASQAKSS